MPTSASALRRDDRVCTSGFSWMGIGIRDNSKTEGKQGKVNHLPAQESAPPAADACLDVVLLSQNSILT